MSEIVKQKLSLFQSLNSSPSRAVGMEEIVRLIRYDSDVANKTESYRKMASVLGKEKADEEVKRRIVPACSIGVLFDGNGRGAANVLGFTGLALCDIDKLDDVDGALARVKADAHTLLAYKTISGQGLRAIYRYTVGGRASKPDGSNDDDCKFAALESRAPTATSWPAAFLKGNRYFAELVGHEYDPQCTDYSRLCGLAHDPDVYVNWEAMPFVITDEEILAANFSPERERGKARKEYAAGTHTANVDDAWPKVEQAL